MIALRAFLLAVLAMIVSPAEAWPVHGSPSAGPAFASIPIGGGGYVTGLSMANDGTMVVRVDVGTAYVSTTSKKSAALQGWTNVITASSMPSGSWGFASGSAGGAYIDTTGGSLGPYEIVVAPGNSQVMYMLWQGKMYMTQNQGVSWALMANFPVITYSVADNNGTSCRIFQKKMAVDPNNANVVYIGTPANGLYVTQNGLSGASATFTQVSTGTIPATVRNGIMAITIDPNSGTTGGVTKHIILGDGGTNYESTNAGGSWAPVAAGGPGWITDGAFDASGNFYAPNYGTNTCVSGNYIFGDVYMYSGGIWYDTGSGAGVATVAINPFDPTWIAGWGNSGCNYNQGTINTTTHTIAWNGPYFGVPTSSSIPPSDTAWISNTRPDSTCQASGGMVFDPVNSGYVWMTMGYGILYVNPANKTSAPSAYVVRSTGVENLVTQAIKTCAGYSNNVLLGVEDQQVFTDTNLLAAPGSSTPQLGSRAYNSAAWSVDASLSSAGVAAALSTGYYVSANGNYSAYSTNCGGSWTQFSTKPTSSDNGAILAIDATHFVVQQGDTVTYTTNAGSSWSAASGLPGALNCPDNFYSPTQCMAQDAAGTAYFYAGANGTYKSTDKGATWAQSSSQYLDSTRLEFYSGKIECVPGNAGYCFLSAGYNSWGPFPSSRHLWKTTNSAASWASVANVTDAWTFGFGAVAPGYTYPTLWLFGFVNTGGGAKFGLWRSRDLGVSDWTYYGYFPGGQIDTPRTMSGDLNDASKVYWGLDCCSFMYGSGLQ